MVIKSCISWGVPTWEGGHNYPDRCGF